MHFKRMQSVLVGVAVAALLLSGTAAAHAESDGASDTADLVSSAVDSAADAADVEVLSSVEQDSALVSEGQPATVSGPADFDGIVEVFPGGRWAGALTGITVGLPDSVLPGTAEVAENGSIVSEAAGATVQAVVQPFDGGMRVSTVIAGPEAPAEFAYELPADVDVALNPDGSASLSRTVIGEDGATLTVGIGEIGQPWAVDANGSQLETRYEVLGNQLIQHVSHDGAAYPVVADPTFWWGWNIYASSKVVGQVTKLLIGGSSAAALGRALLNFLPGIGSLAGNVTTLASAMMAFGAAMINVCNWRGRGVFFGWTWVTGALPFVPTVVRNGYFCVPA